MSRAVALVVIIAASALIVVIRFLHPDWTETELFLRTWPLSALALVGVLLFIRRRTR